MTREDPPDIEHMLRVREEEVADLAAWLAEYMRVCGLPTRHAAYLAEKALLKIKGGALAHISTPASDAEWFDASSVRFRVGRPDPIT